MNEKTVRKILPEEMALPEQVRATAYHQRRAPDAAEADEQAQDRRGREWGCFAPGGELMACAVNHAFTAFLEGKPVPMGGVGGVATLPEYRRGGAVRAIFGPLLQEAREQRETLSALYPFSHAFYRKFGYELADTRSVYAFPSEALRAFAHDGWARPLTAQEGAEEALALYNRFASRYNGALRRDLRQMRRQLPPARWQGDCAAYALGNERKWLAYISYQDRPAEGWGRVLVSRDIAWDGPEGLRAVLGFLHTLEPEYRRMELTLPEDVPLAALAEEPSTFDRTAHHSFMLRLTHVGRALACLPPPPRPYTVAVEDAFLPQNSGVYRVCAEGVTRVREKPDLETSVHALTQLVVGYCDMHMAAMRLDVRVCGNEAALSAAFPRRPLFIQDYF